MQITNTFQNENDDILYKERDVVTHISIFLKGKLVGTEEIGKTRNFMPNTVSHNLYMRLCLPLKKWTSSYLCLLSYEIVEKIK